MAKARTAPARWLRNPLWDLCLLAFCWVPFYLWVVFGLGLGRDTFGLPELDHRSQRAAMLTATLVALGTTYVHRHYTFFVVYGDGHTFRRVSLSVVPPCDSLTNAFRPRANPSWRNT